LQFAAGRLSRTVPFKFSPEDATIGRDGRTSLIGDYSLPFGFTNRVEQVTIDLGPVQPLTEGRGRGFVAFTIEARSVAQPILAPLDCDQRNWPGNVFGSDKRFPSLAMAFAALSGRVWGMVIGT